MIRNGMILRNGELLSFQNGIMRIIIVNLAKMGRTRKMMICPCVEVPPILAAVFRYLH